MKKQLLLGAITLVIAGLLITSAAGVPIAQMSSQTKTTPFASEQLSQEDTPVTPEKDVEADPLELFDLYTKGNVRVADVPGLDHAFADGVKPKIVKVDKELSPEMFKLNVDNKHTLKVEHAFDNANLVENQQVAKKTYTIPKEEKTRGPPPGGALDVLRPAVGVESLYDGANERITFAHFYYRKNASDPSDTFGPTILFQGSNDRGETYSDAFYYTTADERPALWDEPSLHFVGYNTTDEGTGDEETLFTGALKWWRSDDYVEWYNEPVSILSEGTCAWLEVTGDPTQTGQNDSVWDLFAVNWTEAYGGAPVYYFYDQVDAEAAAVDDPRFRWVEYENSTGGKDNLSVLGEYAYVMSNNIDTAGWVNNQGPYTMRLDLEGSALLSFYSDVNYCTKVDTAIDEDSKFVFTEEPLNYSANNISWYTIWDPLNETASPQFHYPFFRLSNLEAPLVYNASDDDYYDRAYTFDVESLNQLMERTGTWSYENPSIAAEDGKWVMAWEVKKVNDPDDEVRTEIWYNDQDGSITNFFLYEFLGNETILNPEIAHVQNDTFVLYVNINGSLYFAVSHTAGASWLPRGGLYVEYDNPETFPVSTTDKSVDAPDGGHMVFFERINNSVPSGSRETTLVYDYMTLEVNGFLKNAGLGPVPEPYGQVIMTNLLENKTPVPKLPAEITYDYPVGAELLTFYERTLFPGIDIYDVNDSGDVTNATMRIIGKNIDDRDPTRGEVGVVDQTFDDLFTVNSEVNVTTIHHFRDLKDFPWYIANFTADEENTTYVNQRCGAAVLQMQLNYLNWNETANPEGVPLEPWNYTTQHDLFDEAIANNSQPGLDYIDWQGMLTTLNNNLPGPFAEYGYNYAVESSATYDDVIGDICIWIDYPVDREGPAGSYQEGYPKHVPVSVPMNGNYSNWMTVRGSHTNRDAWRESQQGNPFDVYGFWVNDPNPFFDIGIGANTYLTATELDDHGFDPITQTGDDYLGQYLAIIEPPVDQPPVDANANIVESPAMWETDPSAGAGNTFLKSMTDSKIVKYAQEGVEELLILDEPLADIYAESYADRPIYVENIADEKESYYLCPMRNTQTKTFTKTLHNQPENTNVVICINANDGHLRGVTYSETPVSYLPITPDVGAELVLQYLGEDDANSRYIDAQYVYRDGSSFYPELQVTYNGQTYYVDTNTGDISC